MANPKWIVWDVEKAREYVRLFQFSNAATVADTRERVLGRAFVVMEALNV